MSIYQKQMNSGFTIVELLIVIVVIGILAAITIVAYNGIQNRAKASSATTTAGSIAKKAEIYNADENSVGGYPSTLAVLTGATSDATYAVPSNTVTAATTFSGTDSDIGKRVLYQVCGHNGAATAAGSAANVIAGTKTGARIGYWSGTGTAVSYINVGIIAHTGSPVAGTNPFIACYNSNS